jgi:hypothetical protein
MRAHLGACASCRRHYDRQLMLASLDPRGRKAKERIARGLGLRSETRSRARFTAWIAAGALVPVAAGLLLFVVRRETGPSSATFVREEPTPRGAPAPTAESPAVWVYRVARDGTVGLAEGTIRADDELAFAYSNTAGWPFLLIFGLDEHRHVYWFHPAWRVGEPAPAAVHASPGPGPFELPEAIRHHTDGRRLTVYALLSRQRIDVSTVEAAIRHAGAAGPLPATFGTERPFVVGRSFVV